MNTERLQILADYLRRVQPSNFDLAEWGRVDMNDMYIADSMPFTKDEPRDKALELIREGACGTSACAVGHACLCPELNAQGLKWDNNTLTPRFGQSTSWYAVQKFFELDKDNARFLFESISSAYPSYDTVTPLMVAENIERFIKDNTP